MTIWHTERVDNGTKIIATDGDKILRCIMPDKNLVVCRMDPVEYLRIYLAELAKAYDCLTRRDGHT